ncbi:MAG TPA: PQQ-binding-like beta-propeller repeat protein [Bryobacteraceae bacterium]
MSHGKEMNIRGYIALVLTLSGTSLLRADWLTFGHDPQRSAWATEETKLTTANVPNLELKWSIQLDNLPLALNALTAPLVARDVVTAEGTKTLVYTAGSSNHLFAVDAATGKVVWKRTFQSFVKAKEDSFYLCPNAVNATPVIDRRRNLIFALAYDGRLFGLDLGTGSIRFGPYQFVPPFAKPWSLNLDNGYIYTTTSQGCGGDRSGIYSMKVDDPARHVSYEMLVRNGGGAGMWARGGTAIGHNGTVYVSTGDGKLDPPNGDFGSTFLAAASPDLHVTDYYSPLNWNEVNKRDLDLPSGGLLWFAYRNWHLVAGGGKESVVYLLDADSLGDKDHQTALYISEQIGNEAKVLEEKGIWGAPALWKDERGEPWIYVTLWGAPVKGIAKSVARNGEASHGSVMAFRVELDQSKRPCLKLAWISPDVNLPDAPAVADGIVFIVATGENPRQDKILGKTNYKSMEDWKSNLLTTEERAAGTRPSVLMALDAKTGKLLFESGSAMKSWNHFGGLAIDDGRIYAVDHASNLYCFGLK